MTRPSWRFVLLWLGVLLLGQAFALPSPVRDAVTESWAAGFQLIPSRWHLVFTPFTSLADQLTALSLRELYALQAWVIVGLILLFRWRFWLALLGWLGFVAWAALAPRPMARLVAADPDTAIIDFHSHSQFSHDGRPSFTPEANMRWHQEQGYHAAFITDHNRMEASLWANEKSKRDWAITGYRSLLGEEISLWKTHLVLLGNPSAVSNKPYDGDYKKIPTFIRDMKAQGYVVIASLPEYWWYHWGPGVQNFIKWGIDGFEVLNSAPKALDFPVRKRRAILDLCRQNNLVVTGISDSHGYGSATAAWNAMSLPGWQGMDPDAFQKAVIERIKTRGFAANRVLERAKAWPRERWQVYVTPPWNAIVYWRSLSPAQRGVWSAWIALAWLLWPFGRRRRA